VEGEKNPPHNSPPHATIIRLVAADAKMF